MPVAAGNVEATSRASMARPAIGGPLYMRSLQTIAVEYAEGTAHTTFSMLVAGKE